MSAFRGLLRKEALHILRDRRTLLVVIFMPILQVILFGYAIRTDISAIRLAIVDPSREIHEPVDFSELLSSKSLVPLFLSGFGLSPGNGHAGSLQKRVSVQFILAFLKK